jgi:hypothetical protein
MNLLGLRFERAAQLLKETVNAYVRLIQDSENVATAGTKNASEENSSRRDSNLSALQEDRIPDHPRRPRDD